MLKRYRPSNGTEGMIFAAQFCDRCVHDINEDCAIFARSLAFGVDHPEYPVEWIEDDRGPLCTAFLAIGDDADLAACRADPRQQSLL